MGLMALCFAKTKVYLLKNSWHYSRPIVSIFLRPSSLRQMRCLLLAVEERTVQAVMGRVLTINPSQISRLVAFCSEDSIKEWSSHLHCD